MDILIDKLIFAGGAAAAAAALAALVANAIVYAVKKKKLSKRLDAEYGVRKKGVR